MAIFLVFNNDFPEDRRMFQDLHGVSALRRATRNNPRIFPCPTCGKPDKLTAKDVKKGYQCDDCADREEGREVS